jgi:hypothetical protein
MKDEFPLMAAHFESETKTLGASIAALGDAYYYFRYLQETMLLAISNGGKPLVVKNTENNPVIFAQIATTRAFSVSKAAVEMAIKGQPQIGIAVSRLLWEINQSTQYLVRHPGLIDGFLKSDVTLERVLKFAKEEDVDRPPHFSEFWGLQSRYSHAGQEFLGIGVETDGYSMTTQVFIYDEEILDKVFYGVLGGMFVQYLIYRAATKGISSIEDKLIERDKYIFDPNNIRKYLGLEMLGDTFIDEMFDFFSK